MAREGDEKYSVGYDPTGDHKGSRSFELTKKEREYLRSGETSTYTEPELHQKVQEKVEEIPDRFQSLFTDVALMYVTGYLTSEQNEEIWDELIHFSHRTDHALNRQTVQLSESGEELKRVFQSDHAFGLGYEIGGLIHMLQSLSSRESAWEDIIWGIVVEYKNSAIHSEESERERYEYLSNLIDDRMFPSEEFYPIPTTPYRIEGEIEKISDIIEKDTTDITSTGVLEAEITKKADEISTSTPIGIGDIEQAFEEVKKDEPLHKIELLHGKLESDVKVLLESEWLGVKAEDTLRAIWELDGNPSSNRIANELEMELAANLITTSIKRLATDDSEKRWTSDPVVSGKTDEWKLTQYGTLVCMYHFESSSSIRWLQKIVFESDEQDNSQVEPVMDQLENLHSQNESNSQSDT